MPITLTRRFHAVGQGLFCSEIVEDGNFKHTVVYDCGTESEDRFLQSETKNLARLVKDRRIDILFLSHLHDDHISGVHRLLHDFYVKKVVLPCLTPFQIIRVYLYANGMVTSSKGERFGDNAVELIKKVLRQRKEHGDSKIFDEIPVFVESISNYDREDALTNGIHDINAYKTYISNHNIYAVNTPSNGTTIEYIPFNIENTKSLVFNIAVKYFYPNLLKELTVGNLGQLINTGLLLELAKLYKCIFGNLNESSMSVLSHVLRPDKNIDCLYTGDYSCKADKAATLLRKYYYKEWHKIAYIQVPHHGSKNDNPVELYSNNCHECVVSYGIPNKHQHPHKDAIKVIVKKTKNHLNHLTNGGTTLSFIDTIF